MLNHSSLLMTLLMSACPQSGLKGDFTKGLLVRGQGVRVVGLRCKVGSKSQLTKSDLRQGGVIQLLLHEEGSWYESRGRAWHEGKRGVLERRMVYVAGSEEKGAGEGLFLKRRVNHISAFKSECLVKGNSRKPSGLLLWPEESEGRGELCFLHLILLHRW